MDPGLGSSLVMAEYMHVVVHLPCFHGEYIFLLHGIVKHCGCPAFCKILGGCYPVLACAGLASNKTLKACLHVAAVAEDLASLQAGSIDMKAAQLFHIETLAENSGGLRHPNGHLEEPVPYGVVCP